MDVVSGVEMETLDTDETSSRTAFNSRPSKSRVRTEGLGECLRCQGCVRPSGHDGDCLDYEQAVLRPKPKAPRLGTYVGFAKDVTCPGDDVTYDVVLMEDSTCALKCTPRLSLFGGGQPPWSCGGKWTFDGWVIDVTV